MHRKVWEWCFISEALRALGHLKPGGKGLGFAVGQEPLVSIFNSYGVAITATDLDTASAAQQGWVETNQHAIGKNILNQKGFCSESEFERLTEFEFVDMRKIPGKYSQKFDFTWSACALEHLGSLAAGMEFILESMKTIKPGGVAIHTTEFNVSSEDSTIEI
jgi:hypothetical protein